MARTLARCAAIFCGVAWGTACAGLDTAAVAETHRLSEVPYYVELARHPPAPGSCAIVLPIVLDPELVGNSGTADAGVSSSPYLPRSMPGCRRCALDPACAPRGLTRSVERARRRGPCFVRDPGAARREPVHEGILERDDDEVGRVLSTERRRDLPGEPLKLEVALDNLLAQLTRGPVQVPAR